MRVTVAGTSREVKLLVVLRFTFPKARLCGVRATPAASVCESIETKAWPSAVVFPGPL
jgi:hypothetical protein